MNFQHFPNITTLSVSVLLLLNGVLSFTLTRTRVSIYNSQLQITKDSTTSLNLCNKLRQGYNSNIKKFRKRDLTCLSMKQKETKDETFLKSITSRLSFYDTSNSTLPEFQTDILPVVDNVTTGLLGKKILSYADLSPETEVTPRGIAFLATNVVYVIAGYMLAFNGNFLLGCLTEIAGIVSFWYHFSQLKFGQDRAEVRLALFTDYITAGSTIITGGWYAVTQVGLNYIPYDVLGVCALSIICLSLSWVWEFGVPYLFWHSLWHIFSAYAGFLVGIQNAQPQ